MIEANLHVSHGLELAARPTASPFARRRGSDPERDLLWLEAVEAVDQATSHNREVFNDPENGVGNRWKLEEI